MQVERIHCGPSLWKSTNHSSQVQLIVIKSHWPQREYFWNFVSPIENVYDWNGIIFFESSYGMQDLQGEAPYHLLHLKIGVEKNRFLASVEECRTELDRETKLVAQEGSEKIIKEHRVRLTHPKCRHAKSHCYLKDLSLILWLGSENTK